MTRTQLRRALLRLRCYLASEQHLPPDDHDPERRWATCVRCGELFDAARRAETGERLREW